MPNTILKATKIAEAANLLLQREIVLPRLVASMPIADFVGVQNDTVTRRIPAVRTAGSRTMRSATALAATDLTQTSVPVVLDTHVYDLLAITDEELTLDIGSFAATVLAPQLRSVVEGLEDRIAAVIQAASFTSADVAFDSATDEPFDVAVECRKALNKLNVSTAGRVLLLGADVEAEFLKSDKLTDVDRAGESSALRDATLGRLAGFTVVVSNAIPADSGFAFQRDAFVFAAGAPALPDGANMKARVSSESMALRYLRDYDPTAAGGPVDRSLVDAFVGCSSVDDGAADTNPRGVEIAFT